MGTRAKARSRIKSKSETRVSTWFATASPIKRRQKSDRKEVPYEVLGISVSDANRSAPDAIGVERCCAGAKPAAARRRGRVRQGPGDNLLHRRGQDALPVARRRKIRGRRPAARRKGCAGRRSEDRQCRHSLP